MPDRRVFDLPRASSDRADHDFAGVHTDSNLNRSASFGTLAVGVAADFLLHPQRRIERALRMVLVREWRAEQREDAVTRRLHHVAVVTMGRIDSAGSMIARASSGSRSSISSVEPLMSANSAVTVLRSPSTAGEASGSSAATRIAATAVAVGRACDDDVVSGAPQSPQNLSPGSFDAPHRGHFETNGAPHPPQNLRPSRLSDPHFAQRTATLIAGPALSVSGTGFSL